MNIIDDDNDKNANDEICGEMWKVYIELPKAQEALGFKKPTRDSFCMGE